MRPFKMTALVSFAAAIALGASACASSAPATPVSAPADAGAAAADCRIDAVKICQTIGGGAAKNPAPMAMAPTGGYGASSATMPDTVEFSIPAGPTLQLMCYYDPQHSKVTRADVANQVAMTPGTVKYLRDQGFCGQ